MNLALVEFKVRTSRSIRTSAKFAMINPRALKDERLKKSDLDLLSILSIMGGCAQYCYPSINYLCIALDLNPFTNKRNIRKRLALLEKCGYITRKRRYHLSTSGRQTTNGYFINFDKFTPPLNRLIERKKKNIKKRKKISLLHPLEGENLKTSSRSPGLPLVLDSPRRMPLGILFKKVFGWHKRLKMRNDTSPSAFWVQRSKYKEIRRPIRLPANNRRKNMPTPILDEIDHLLGVVMTSNRNELSPTAPGYIPPPHLNETVRKVLETFPNSKIETIQDKLENRPEYIKKPPTWPEICRETSKRNITFSSWTHGIVFRSIEEKTMILDANSQFFRDTIEVRYATDIKNACKLLGYEINVLEIKIKNQ